MHILERVVWEHIEGLGWTWGSGKICGEAVPELNPGYAMTVHTPLVAIQIAGRAFLYQATEVLIP